jgi:outer membrane murein-binding lipoprotein Lpp
MPARALLVTVLLLAPAAASARDVATCAALYKQLNNLRQVIGNTAEMRRYAQELSVLGSQIRSLRIDMRRSRCGGGSIVVLGASHTNACEDLADDLRALEAARDALAAERDQARIKPPPAEREFLLAEVRANSCIPSDVEEAEKEQRKMQGIELPKEEPQSAVIELRTMPAGAVAQAPTEPVNLPGPERPYDPSKKVRTVGPVFLPERKIDLANPQVSGPQPLQ